MPAARSVWSNRSGSVATEAALLAPVVLFLLAGIVDYGHAVREEMALNGAVRAGLQYALHLSADPARVEQAVRAASAGDPAALTVAVTRLCECPDGTAVDCLEVCADGARRSFVHIDARRAHPTLMPWPGIDNPTTLAAEARVRIQ